MSNLLEDMRSAWYREIQPTSFFNESDLENTVLAYLAVHLKDHFIVKCKMDVENITTKKRNRPDLAIIKKDYSEWFVVEVELSTHNDIHILEQVNTFINGEYSKDHSLYLFKKDKINFDQAKLNEMVDKVYPKVMVIVNELNKTLEDSLKVLGCYMSVFKIYFDKEQNRIYRFKGDFPLMLINFSTCKFVPGLPNVIELLHVDFLDVCNVKDGDEVSASYNGKLSKWVRRNSGNRVFLNSMDRNIPLDTTTSRYIVSLDDLNNEFVFNKA